MKLKAKAKVYFFLSPWPCLVLLFDFVCVFRIFAGPQFFKFLSFCQRFSLLTILNGFLLPIRVFFVFLFRDLCPIINNDNLLDNN